MGNLAQTEKGSAASTSMANTQTTENSGVLTADNVVRVQEAFHVTGQSATPCIFCTSQVGILSLALILKTMITQICGLAIAFFSSVFSSAI